MAESTLAGLRRQRIEKIERLREIGMNPYPSQSVRTHMSREIVDGFDSLEGERRRACGRSPYLYAGVPPRGLGGRSGPFDSYAHAAHVGDLAVYNDQLAVISL